VFLKVRSFISLTYILQTVYKGKDRFLEVKMDSLNQYNFMYFSDIFISFCHSVSDNE
jgi:hypothetical protein